MPKLKYYVVHLGAENGNTLKLRAMTERKLKRKLDLTLAVNRVEDLSISEIQPRRPAWPRR